MIITNEESKPLPPRYRTSNYCCIACKHLGITRCSLYDLEVKWFSVCDDFEENR